MSLPIFLSDVQFLSQLYKLPVKEEYVRITILDWQENPIQQIQGIVINGNVNLDGNSSMRRTASLTVFAEQTQNDLQNINSLFAINKKCKLEKGIRNTVVPYVNQATNEIINYQEQYGQIVWFPLGIYVMFNPAISHQMTGVNISVQLKDKMCLLNGDLGGQIHSSIEFNYADQVVDNNGSSVTKSQRLIYDIILELINHWGNEDINKIFITEVPSMIKKVAKWVGNQNIYIVEGSDKVLFLDLEEAEDAAAENGKEVHTFEPGADIGYFYDTFTYPGQLVSNAGDTITNVLDKIIGVLGNYEYFYDVEGNFIFQEKKNYLNMSNTAYWTKQSDQNNKFIEIPSDQYIQDYARLSKPVYDFSDNNFFTAYNNTLNYNNIKNDFIVWGSRKNSADSNTETIIRFHFAIDMRPRYNSNKEDNKKTYTCMLYKEELSDIVRGKYIIDKIPDSNGNYVDIMSEDEIEKPIQYGFYKINGEYYQYIPLNENAEIKVYQFKTIDNIQQDTGSTYPKVLEPFKQEDIKDWRQQLYYQMLEDEKYGTGYGDLYNQTYYQYYAEIKEEFPKMFNLESHSYRDDYYNHPDSIDYFLDMIDQDTELGKYSIRNIGKRTLVIANNNQGINCIFEPNIPDIVYIAKNQYDTEKRKQVGNLLSGYKQQWAQISDYLYNSMQQGGKLNSCYEKIKDLLYQYTQMNQTVSITGLPIYHLEPNTRITIHDNASGIYGDFIIQSISLPLDISSTMSINAYKALTKI